MRNRETAIPRDAEPIAVLELDEAPGGKLLVVVSNGSRSYAVEFKVGDWDAEPRLTRLPDGADAKVAVGHLGLSSRLETADPEEVAWKILETATSGGFYLSGTLGDVPVMALAAALAHLLEYATREWREVTASSDQVSVRAATNGELVVGHSVEERNGSIVSASVFSFPIDDLPAVRRAGIRYPAAAVEEAVESESYAVLIPSGLSPSLHVALIADCRSSTLDVVPSHSVGASPGKRMVLAPLSPSDVERIRSSATKTGSSILVGDVFTSLVGARGSVAIFGEGGSHALVCRAAVGEFSLAMGRLVAVGYAPEELAWLVDRIGGGGIPPDAIIATTAVVE